MKLEKLLIPIIIGICGLSSQAYATYSLNKYKPLINNLQDVPKEPKREVDYFGHISAILPPKDEVLEYIEIKNKK